MFTGTGFPGDFYINYHLYRIIFHVWALGRAVRALLDGEQGDRPSLLTPRRSAPPRGTDTSPRPPVHLEISRRTAP